MASITKTYRFIFKHLLSYLSLFITSIVVIYAGIIPLFTLIGSIMLRLAGVRYLSNTNFLEVVTNHPFLDIGCLLLILAVIVAIYWQVTFLFLGIMQINQGKKLALNSLITLSFQRVRHTFGRAVGYLLIYCLIILPFGGLGISTPLLNKVRVPDFIIIELVLLLMSIALGTGSLMIMADQLKNQASFVTSSRQLSNQLQRLSYQSGKHWWFKALAGVLFLGILGFNALYLNGFFTSTPLTISHRGVNAKNGVQNTIPALINTSRLHPDFIEMDLHETKASNSITTFNKRYGKRLVANHDEVHSLDYDAVEKLKTLNPKLQVGYILPFNFIGVPQSKADFYTMEHSTLNNSFLITAQLTGRKVYAWTVNDRDVMAKLTFMGVNGIITDNLETLQHTIQQLNHHPNYVSRLLNFTVELG